MARYFEKQDIEAIILHEKPSDGGKTLIEKLEKYSSEIDIGFAVILLTPDDTGKAIDKKGKPKLRARQNVILELGYFMGKLGRSRVFTLYKGEVELPNDVVGVVYIPFDDQGAWMVKLGKELKEIKYNIDFSKFPV